MSGSTPFFTILIPTKNRSHLVGFALESVINQTFGDFEVIVSDNDDSDTATHDAVARYRDSRIRYYRTNGKLSMPDNWEYALSKAQGQYVTVLEDKQALYPNALEIIHDVITRTGMEVVTWRNDAMDDSSGNPVLMLREREEVTFERLDAESLVSDYISLRAAWAKLPRMINSCASRKVIEKVITGNPLKRFFIDASPDLCAAFMQLNYVDDTVHIRRPLSVWGASSLSNAHRIRKKDIGHKRSIEEVGGDSAIVSLVPIKSVYIVRNGVYNDYLKLAKMLHGRLARYTMSSSNYALMCIGDLAVTYAKGGSIGHELKLWLAYVRHERLQRNAGFWTKTLRAVVGVVVDIFIRKHTRLANLYYALTRSKVRIATGYNSVLDVVNDTKLFTIRGDEDKRRLASS